MKRKLWLLLAVVLPAIAQSNFAADADLSKLAAANNSFAFNLLKELNAENPAGNIFNRTTEAI